jgi:hypothetical protein
MDRVFLDANVLFSAAYRAENGLLRFWALSDAVLLSSAYAIDEARRNLADAQAILRLEILLDAVTVVADAPHAMALPDGVTLPAKDVPILLAAIAGQATHLLTGDLRHFGPLYGKTVGGVLVCPPADYCKVLPGS